MDSRNLESVTLAYAAPVSGRPEAVEEPRPAHPAGDGQVVVCASCGQENSVGADQCARPTCRKTLKGNGLANRTGLQATRPTQEEEAIEAAGRALVEQSILDAGGRSELAARELSDHEYRGLLHARILKLARALDAHGDFDRRGRLRKGWIELLDRLIASAVSLDKTLGLARKAKAVTLHDYLEQQAQTREPGV